MENDKSSPKTEFRASKRCRMPEKGRRSSQRNELYSWLRSLQIDCSWPNSEAEPQICDSPRFAIARAPLELLPPSVLRHPEELASN
ncbi:unnamed protein product [Prunus armeniaca]